MSWSTLNVQSRPQALPVIFRLWQPPSEPNCVIVKATDQDAAAAKPAKKFRRIYRLREPIQMSAADNVES